MELKKDFPELRNVHSKVLQHENYRLFSNLRALSRLKKRGKKVGRLRFKGRDRFKTFSYNQSGFIILQNDTRYDKLWLSKIGEIPLIMHRMVEGDIKQITIKRHPSEKWYACIVAETEKETPKTENEKVIGIDVGLINYVYDSDGNHFDNPKCVNMNLGKLRKRQRELSRKRIGSNNRVKAKIKVARVHEKTVNQRDDFLHKLSRYYVNNYGFITVENLQISNMVRHPNLARSIMDASWSCFIRMLEYKAERAGVRVVKVDAKGTTQICSNCGKCVHKELWKRIHRCPYCGLEIYRDYNSAIEMLKRALLLGQQEVTPVEIGPLQQHK